MTVCINAYASLCDIFSSSDALETCLAHKLGINTAEIPASCLKLATNMIPALFEKGIQSSGFSLVCAFSIGI